MTYSHEVEHMCVVKKGPNHGPAPIPEEGKWVKSKEIVDISGLTHGIGWCAPQQGACKLTLNVKEGIIQEALIETIGCSGMTHSAAMASEILPGKTVLEALNTDLVCDAINTAMRELFLQIVYGRTQSAFSEGGLMIGAGLEDLGNGLRSQVGTLYGTLAKGPRYLEMAEGYIKQIFLDKNDEICGYEFVHMGKFMDEIKKGTDANEALKKVTGTYGRFTAEQGGDGASYDIGYGGLDHVIASGEDVNILVLDTEVYSNTGGQSSKATPLGAIAKFAASGKRVRKKDLGMIATTYGYVYVAQIAMGADQAQTLKAIREAEAYPGPSLVIAYAPCINHGLKAGMGKSQAEEAKAVECGYWHLWRFNPALEEEGKNPFSLDSKEPNWEGFQDYLKGEVRFASVMKQYPTEAADLFAACEDMAKKRYASYKRMAAMDWSDEKAE